MTAPLTLVPGKTAVLIMDYQTAIVAMMGGESDPLLQRAARVLQAARDARIPVIHVVVGFRPGYPEVSSKNDSFGPIKQSGRFLAGTAGTEIHPTVAPRGEEPTVTKHRGGAFSGTDLEMILRSCGAETLVLLGLSTSGVVLSTLRHAADTDYRCVVLQDCCGDPDPEVHRCLTEKVFVRQATIARAEDFIAAASSLNS